MLGGDWARAQHPWRLNSPCGVEGAGIAEEQQEGWSCQEDGCAAASSAGPSKPGHVSNQLLGTFGGGQWEQ